MNDSSKRHSQFLSLITKNNFEINFKNQKNVLKKERIWNKMVKKISKDELKTKSLNDTKFWYYII